MIKLALPILLIFIIHPLKSISQSKLDGLLKKVEKTVNTVNGISQGVGRATNGVKKSVPENSGQSNSPGKQANQEIREDKGPLNSEIYGKRFVQNSSNPPFNSQNTRVRLVGNLLVDIEGKYPAGYGPSWDYIKKPSTIKLIYENWMDPSSSAGTASIISSLDVKNERTVFRFKSNYENEECYADLVTDDTVSVLSENMQTYELTNFRRILNGRYTDQPCVRAIPDIPFGGFLGKISLSANRDGDLNADLMLEIYNKSFTVDNYFNQKTGRFESNVYVPSKVLYRFIAENMEFKNGISARAAVEKVEREAREKKAYADYIAKSEKQIANLMTSISKKYPGYDCISCYSRNSNYGTESIPTKTTYWYDGRVEYGTDWTTYNTLSIRNRCNQDLTIVGIVQRKNDAGYYYEDVSMKMPANYVRESKEELWTSVFTSVFGLDGDIRIYPKYDIEYAMLDKVQWIKVVGKNKPILR